MILSIESTSNLVSPKMPPIFNRVFPVVYVGLPSYFTGFLASRLRRSKGTTGSAGVAVSVGTLVAAKPVEAGWEIINGDDATGL